MRTRAKWLVLGALALAYAVFYWRFCNIYDTDHGRWMYEAWRFGKGEIPYREIAWQYPPLALYVFGYLSRLFSGDVLSGFVGAATLYLGLCAFSVAWVRDNLPRPIWFVALFGILSGFIYRPVNWGAAPLPTGTYCSAQPLGGFFLLLAMWLAGKNREKGRAGPAIAVGILCGLCVMTKHDFWVPAAMVSFLAAFRWHKKFEWRATEAIYTWGFSVFTIVSLGALFTWHAGFEYFRDMFSGYGQMGARQFSLSLEVVSQQLFFGSALAFLFFLFARKNDRAENKSIAKVLLAVSLLSFFLYSFSTDWKWLHAAQDFSNAVGKQKLYAIPFVWLFVDWAARFFLPVSLLGLPACFLFLRRHSWKENADLRWLTYFLLLAFAARARRGLVGYDWYYLWFDLPLLFSFLRCWNETHSILGFRRIASFVVMIQLVMALGNHVLHGIETVQTPRGMIRMPAHLASVYREIRVALDQVDPTGKYPVAPFRFQSMSLFLSRPNPLHITQGFGLTSESDQEIIEQVREKKPILLMSAGQVKAVPDHYRQWTPVSEIAEGYGGYSEILKGYRLVPTGEKLGPWALLVPK